VRRSGSREAARQGGIEDSVQPALRDVFGHSSLRPAQQSAISALLDGKDVVLLLPTGGGKSLCYQLPAVVLGRAGQGPTLVVSPLVALMEDQVARLRSLGVRASALHRATPSRDRSRIMSTLGEHELLYVAPERLSSERASNKAASARFIQALYQARTARVAIDEAHCISEWGHDFRPDYQALGLLKEELGLPTIAVTATATPTVLGEISRALGLVEPVVVRTPFHRDNLALAVEHHRGDQARTKRLMELLREEGLGEDADAGRVVVYAATRARTTSVAKALRKAGFAATHYHGGRTIGARATAQKGFEAGKHAVMVATTAFGMGIDHPDVRMVVHVQSPGTLEAYAQQSGRAGRDGQPARCVLLYGPGDAATQARLRGDRPYPGALEGWKALQDYAFGDSCRMGTLARRFGDEGTKGCGRCDVCEAADTVSARVEEVRSEGAARAAAAADKRERDTAVELDDTQKAEIVRFVEGLRKPLGKRLVAAGLRGGRSKPVVRWKLPDNPLFGALKGVPEAAVIRAIEGLLAAGQLAARGKKYPTLWIPQKRVRAAGGSKPRAEGGSQHSGTHRSGTLRSALRDLRKREARRRRWKPYQVFPDKTLEAILEKRPATVAELMELPGIGPARIAKFSEAILTLVRRHGETGGVAAMPPE
jgi:ATP-dependent DNA helicase RecQ